MEITVDDLKKIRFFDDYTDQQLEIFTAISCIKEIAVKEVLFEQYDKLSEVAVLLEGTLSLGISLAKEKRIHLGTIEEGQFFSWSALFTPFIATAWVMAVTPAKLLAIDAVKLREEIDKDCSFGFRTMSKIAVTLSQRLSDTRFQLMNQLML
ncbi:MAG TPA: Crp/Fnr family transcriptional regulator [Bacteroidales bacterium]|nr:Crp/Fnr family transcriptional regulator [Bacteroidales bacterium]HPF03183.1 Crp/Fnr family transcriptional regulator [Bacteroidales bacterium]HPJ58306.1 Crp/Fnr family transcriptional regulator [Bacteroidales bacterium]HPR10888.1 Crp/Fnr family transcriptional regulator [Bacteroidales bacterium]HRW84152.1 Crp/Fnr family transcriptional regulator [Bacteroidales bacterium]